jgi:hypothetical protein
VGARASGLQALLSVMLKLAVEQAAQKVAKSSLSTVSRITRVPEEGNLPLVTPEGRLPSSKRRGIKPAAATYSRRQRHHMDEI